MNRLFWMGAIALAAGCSVGAPASVTPSPSSSSGPYAVSPSQPPGRVETSAYAFSYPTSWTGFIIGDVQNDPYVGTSVTLHQGNALIDVNFTAYVQLDLAGYKDLIRSTPGVNGAVSTITDLQVGGEAGFKAVQPRGYEICAIHQGHYLQLFADPGKDDPAGLDAGVDAILKGWTWK